MTEKIEFKDRLREAMKLKGIRSVDIVENTNIPKSAVSYYLAGKSQPKADRLHILAKYLDISEAWLLGYDVPMNRTPMQKKNDDLVQIIAKLRKESDFYADVSMFADLSETDRATIRPLLVALHSKKSEV